jgi:hypothetical protein
MNRSTPKLLDFAGRLMAYESREKKTSAINNIPAAFPVVEKLRPRLGTLMGSVGFRALLSRALVLARAEVPSLRAVHVNEDGSLQGLDELEGEVDPDETFEGRKILVAQLLGLLVAFIGENLTVRLVREVWPDVSLNDFDLNKKDKNENTK